MPNTELASVEGNIIPSIVGGVTSPTGLWLPHSSTALGSTQVLFVSNGTAMTQPRIMSGFSTTPTSTSTSNIHYISTNTCPTNISTSFTSTVGTYYIFDGTSWIEQRPQIVRYIPPKPDYKKIKIERNYARKALWKSIRLFEDLFGINQIKLFLNGESFDIQGRVFNYRISKNRYGLIEHTQNPKTSHIPYKLEVLNKNGLVLFQGCTVFKNTPIVDQITALLLHITSGEEEHVLKNMNLFNIHENFYNDLNSIEYINEIKNTMYKPKLIT